MANRKTILRSFRKQLKLCICGDHAWTPLTRGHITLVSPQDAHLLQNQFWCAHEVKQKTYAKSAIGFLHRNIVKDACLIDHKNHNGTDNRRHNIRAANKSLNACNTKILTKRESKFRGVEKIWRKWRAYIRSSNKTFYLGMFSTAEDAARAYDAAALKYFGEFASLNFPTGERDRSYEAFDHRVESPSALSWQQLALPFSHDPATNE